MTQLNTKETSFSELRDKVIYLASPYSAYKDLEKTEHDRAKEQERFEVITGVAAKLTELFHFALICPITTSHLFKQLSTYALGTTWSFWSQVDLQLLGVAEAILVVKMEGWDESVGVEAEIKHARNLYLPVYYLDINTDILTKEVN